MAASPTCSSVCYFIRIVSNKCMVFREENVCVGQCFGGSNRKDQVQIKITNDLLLFQIKLAFLLGGYYREA